MANSLLTIDKITNEVLRLAHEKASFIGTINRQFDSSFGRSDGKIGDTLRIRLPSQYTRRQGSRVMDVQDAEEQQVSLVSATQDGVDMRFNSRELSLDLQNFSQTHLEPAVATLISGVESDVLQGCIKSVYNLVGTPGTTPASLLPYGQARAKLNQYLAPKDNNRFVQADSLAMAALVNGAASYFNPQSDLSKQYREGLIGRTAMADFYENERTYIHTVGGDVTTVTVNDASIASGDSSVVTSGGTLVVGDVFTFADVYAVHPETKASYGHLQQFTVTAVSGSAGSQTITFSPALYSTGAKKNVSALPANSAAIVAVGTASTAYQHNLMYHKDAFTFATAELPLMADASKCVTKTYDGLSVRVWQASDIRNDEMLTRIDILYGYKAIRPQWACRITS